VDNNFNGVQDMGDVPASWVVLSANTATTLRSRQFLWGEGVGFPCRPAYDFITRTLYLAQNGRIKTYDTRSLGVKQDTFLLIEPIARSIFGTTASVAGLSYEFNDNNGLGLGSLFITLRSVTSSSVFVYSPTGRTTFLSRYPAGSLAQQAIHLYFPGDRTGLAILNEGIFGTSTSTVQIIDGNQNTVINVGDTGNHIFFSPFRYRLIVTVNGSHQVHIIELVNGKQITRTIPTNTSGFNGPRESVLIGNTLYVTTYASDVRMFDITTGAELGRLNPRGKPEGIAALGNSIVVANAFESGGFASATSVVVLNPSTSVKNTFDGDARVSLFPNPTRDRTTIRIQGEKAFSENAVFTLVNPLGKTIATLTAHNTSASTMESEFSAEELGLAQGMYFVQIRTAQGMTAVPVQMLR
jgi:hypothetical protein